MSILIKKRTVEDNVLNRSRINIANNKLEAVLPDLLAYLEGKPQQNELIVISQTFHAFSADKRKGILSHEQEVLQQNRITNSLLELINELDRKEADVYLSNRAPTDETTTLLDEFLDILAITHEAFIAQAKIRNLLVANIVDRLQIRQVLQYEVFFSTYFPQMSDEELRLHRTIRSYTEHVLARYNQQVLDLITQNKSLKQAIPRLKELEQHLVIWLGKYQGVFQTTPSMSLVYVGVEEGVPFPRGIEQDIKHYLGKQG